MAKPQSKKTPILTDDPASEGSGKVVRRISGYTQSLRQWHSLTLFENGDVLIERAPLVLRGPDGRKQPPITFPDLLEDFALHRHLWGIIEANPTPCPVFNRFHNFKP